MPANRDKCRNILWLLGLLIVVGMVHVTTLILGRTALEGRRFANQPLHAALEVAGAVIALLAARLLVLLDRRQAGASHNITIAGALVGMGLLDGLHAVFHAGNLSSVWLQASACFVGGALFVLVWLPERWSPSCWTRWPWVVAVVVMSLGAVSMVFPDWMSVAVGNGRFTVSMELMNFAGGLLMCLAALRLVQTYRRTGRVENLLLCLQCGVFGAAALMIEQFSLWDFTWWGWHVLRLLSGGVVLWYLLLAEEQSLHMSRAVLESTIEGIITIDEHGRILAVNPATARMFGYDAGDLVGQHVRMLMPSPHREHHDEYIADYLRTGDRKVIGLRRELIARRSDGTHFPVELTVTEVVVRNCRLFTGMVRDLTRTRLAEQNLHLMRAAIDSASEAMYTIAPDGRFLDVNDTACQRLGYSREELLTLSVWDVDAQSSAEKWPGLWEQFRERERVMFETEHRTKSGQHFPVEVSRFHVTFDGSEYVCGFARDISRRKRAQRALKQSEERFRQLAVHLQDVLWMTTADGRRVIYVNPAYESLWGRSAASLYKDPRSWCEAIHEEDRQRVIDSFFARAADAGFDETYRIVRPDGSIRWVHATGSPIRNECGEVYRIGGVARDVTHRAEHEQALKEAKAAADAANHSKSEFLANMSHEIRTPLTGILGFTDVLRRGLGTEDQQETYLETISASGQHLLTLIDDILDLSRIEAGQMIFERVSCSPHEIIADVLSILRVRARDKNLRLECVWRSGVPETIYTDPARVRQLLMNVVGNAIKFTETGSVQLVVSIDQSLPGRRFEIEVRDTGIGIPADRLERVFSPFDQLDTSITRRYGGTGLGLAISRHIARGLGGEITVDSEPGRGSVFRILLETGPLEGVRILDVPQAEALRRTNGATENESPSLHDVSILLVEDGETNRDLIRLVLKDAGASVLCAEDGRQGLEAALTGNFDVILMDMQMPVMDGYEATRRLRELGYTAPILALTAHAMRGDREKCLAAGCSGYLTKPIDVDRLLQAIVAVLPAANSVQRPEACV